MRPDMPTHLRPMLAVGGAMPPDPQSWAFEYKWDGVRALAYWSGGRMTLQSRNLNDITARYPELVPRADEIGCRSAIFDGEIIAPDEQGRPSFHRLQYRMHLTGRRVQQGAEAAPVMYFLFDILWRDGRSLMDEPYRMRRRELAAVTLTQQRWRVPPSHEGRGPEMLAGARQWGLEGLVAKRPQSPYRPGQRGGDWVKIKIVHRQEFVIGGWEPRARQGAQIGSLLVGYHDQRGRLRFAGRVGTGFDARLHRDLTALFAKLQRKKTPFADPIDRGPAPAVFLAPRLVAEIDYRRWPAGQRLQQASFLGLRDDKDPKEVVLEERK
ncbi:MAG: non-homologous end-joining DNA ligase [Planctomycetaceae bacterium]|nr:non-homologous end-joining DNA ligase [Planctomycetaceae bacterium]